MLPSEPRRMHRFPVKNIQWVQLENFHLKSMGVGPVGFSPPIEHYPVRING